MQRRQEYAAAGGSAQPEADLCSCRIRQCGIGDSIVCARRRKTYAAGAILLSGGGCGCGVGVMWVW